MVSFNRCTESIIFLAGRKQEACAHPAVTVHRRARGFGVAALGRFQNFAMIDDCRTGQQSGDRAGGWRGI